MERVDPRTVLPVKVATFTEQRKTEDMRGALAGGKAAVAVEPNKTITKDTVSIIKREALRRETAIAEKGKSHEGRFCSTR